MEDNLTEERVTRRYLLEVYGITDEDLEGIELETIVEMHDVYIWHGGAGV